MMDSRKPKGRTTATKTIHGRQFIQWTTCLRMTRPTTPQKDRGPESPDSRTSPSTASRSSASRKPTLVSTSHHQKPFMVESRCDLLPTKYRGSHVLPMRKTPRPHPHLSP